MSKLFHAAAIAPSALAGSRSLTILREFRLDRARYIEKVPGDWLERCKRVIQTEDNAILRMRALELLRQMHGSILSSRADGAMEAGSRRWQELVAILSKTNQFDVVVDEKEVKSAGGADDLDDYLFQSELELGAVDQMFVSGIDWIELARPVLLSDNCLLMVDRYIDVSRYDYEKAFRALFLFLTKNTRIKEVKVVVGPESKREDESLEAIHERTNRLIRDMRMLINKSIPSLRSNVLVFCVKGLHKRYLATKYAGLELDFGFRVSNRDKQKVSVLRSSQLLFLQKEYMSLAAGGRVAWPEVR